MSHADRQHAKLAPSSAHRWLHCPGSVALSAGVQEAPSIFAAEGTAAHELAEKCLRDGVDATKFRGQKIGGFTVDAEMVEGVQLYLDVVREIADESDDFESEQRMDMTALVPGVFGTGDAIAYRELPTRRVMIADLKYGKGVAVDVEENEQLLTYAAGVAQRYHNRGVDEVELVIVQPRAPHRDGPVRRWTTDIVGLYEHIAALQRAEKIIAAGNAPLVPGAWCKFCKAAALCPALDNRIREITMTDPETKSFRDWKEEEADITLVKGWANAREQFAHSEALQGRMPPGAKLVGKKAFRKWIDADAAVNALRVVGVSDDDLYDTKVASPAQVEKCLPKKLKSLIGTLAEAKSSGTVLAPIDDPRVSVDPNDARGFDAVEIAER